MRKDFRGALEAAFRHALEYLKQVDDRPVGPTVTVEELRRRVCKELDAQGMDGAKVIDELVRDSDGGLDD